MLTCCLPDLDLSNGKRKTEVILVIPRLIMLFYSCDDEG